MWPHQRPPDASFPDFNLSVNPNPSNGSGVAGVPGQFRAPAVSYEMLSQPEPEHDQVNLPPYSLFPSHGLPQQSHFAGAVAPRGPQHSASMPSLLPGTSTPRPQLVNSASINDFGRLPTSTYAGNTGSSSLVPPNQGQFLPRTWVAGHLKLDSKANTLSFMDYSIG